MLNVTNAYDTYAQPLYAFFFYRVNDQATAEDLTSELFLNLTKTAERFDDSKSSVRTWLYRCARNLLTDHYRRTSHYPTALEEAEEVPDREVLAASVLRNEQSTQIRTALATLSESQREVLIMRFWDELSFEEIAAITNRSSGANRTLASRAIAQLRDQLGPITFIIILNNLLTYTYAANA